MILLSAGAISKCHVFRYSVLDYKSHELGYVFLKKKRKKRT